MKFRKGFIWLLTGLLSLLLFVSTSAFAQDPQDKPEKDPPSEGFADTLKRMQIKRAEDEHKKLVKSAHQAAAIADTLSPLIKGNQLGRAAEKKLKEIEKAAKQIRRNVGGSNKDEDFETPKTLVEAVDRLVETSKQLSEQMDKTSRHIISADIIVSSNDMLRLIKFLREYLN